MYMLFLLFVTFTRSIPFFGTSIAGKLNYNHAWVIQKSQKLLKLGISICLNYSQYTRLVYVEK